MYFRFGFRARAGEKQETTFYWKIFVSDTFGEDFSKAGCMYRGPPPEGKLYHLTPEFQSSLTEGRKYSVKFSSFEWTLNESVEEKVRQKCSNLLSDILSDEDSDLKLGLKISRKNLSEVIVCSKVRILRISLHVRFCISFSHSHVRESTRPVLNCLFELFKLSLTCENAPDCKTGIVCISRGQDNLTVCEIGRENDSYFHCLGGLSY